MSEEELRGTTTLRIVTKCRSMQELAVRFAALVDDDSIFVAPPTPLQPGERRNFVVQLADGTVALAGYGEVSDAHAQLGSRSGARLRFVSLDSQARSSLDRMLAVKQRPDPAAPLRTCTTLPGMALTPADLTMRASPPPIAAALHPRAAAGTAPPEPPSPSRLTARGSTAGMLVVESTPSSVSDAVPRTIVARDDDTPAVIHAAVPAPREPSIPTPVVRTPPVETVAREETMPELRAIRRASRLPLGVTTLGAAFLLGIFGGFVLARLPEATLAASAAMAGRTADATSRVVDEDIAPATGAPSAGDAPTKKKGHIKRAKASRHRVAKAEKPKRQIARKAHAKRARSASPTAAAPAMARLSLASKPPGATFTVNGKGLKRGATATMVRKSSTVKITAVLRGHKRATYLVKVARPTKVVIPLQPLRWGG